LIDGSPIPSPEGPYLGPEGKKELPEFASPYRHQDTRYPLSAAVNERAINFASVPKPAGKQFYNSVPYWLILYFCFNLGLTLFNKVVLVSFPFPYVSWINKVTLPAARSPHPTDTHRFARAVWLRWDLHCFGEGRVCEHSHSRVPRE
jgi:hypothetical protein